MNRTLQMKPLRLLALILGLSVCSVATAHAQQDPAPDKKPSDEGTLLAYVDDDGRIHVVNSIEMIPQRFRSRARPVKLGEVSTISPSSSSSKRTRKDPQRRTSRPVDRQVQPTTRTTTASDASNNVETKEEALLRLRTRRKEVVDQLGLLDEGWMKDGSSKEPSVNELETRSRALSKELQELDKAIAKREASR